MRRERVQQLGVGEADPHGLDLSRTIWVGPGHRDGLRPVVDDLARDPELDRVLGGREMGHGAAPVGIWDGAGGGAQLSMTWPPVTGSAWPVSYCWATR